MKRSAFTHVFSYGVVFMALGFVAGLLHAHPALGQPPPTGAKPDKGAIHIKSDRMEATDQAGLVVFTGSVVATRDEMTIHSDRLEVFYVKTPDPAGTSGETKKKVDKLVAKGHVRINQEGKIATGEEAIYEKGAQKLTLIGTAQAWEGQNHVQGNRITFFLKENRSVVEGSATEKVEAVVYPAD